MYELKAISRRPTWRAVALLLLAASGGCVSGSDGTEASDAAVMGRESSTPVTDSGTEPGAVDGSDPGAPTACSAGAQEERVRYASERVANGESCRSEVQTRVCRADGWDDWSGVYSAPSCAVDTAGPQAPEQNPSCDGEAVGARQSRIRYASASADGGACRSEVQYRTCEEVGWSGWTGAFREPNCVACEDVDGDGHGLTCPLGPDCDDHSAACFEGCDIYQRDEDGDGYGDPIFTTPGCETPRGYLPESAPRDCAPQDAAHHSDCGVCVDADGDDHGDGCDLGEDCDDSEPRAFDRTAPELPWNQVDDNCDGVLGVHLTAELVLKDPVPFHIDPQQPDPFQTLQIAGSLAWAGPWEAGNLRARYLDDLGTPLGLAADITGYDFRWYSVRVGGDVVAGVGGLVGSSLTIVNVSDPLHPAPVDLSHLGNPKAGNIWLSAGGRRLWAAESQVLRLYDLADLTQVSRRGTVPDDTDCFVTDDGSRAYRLCPDSVAAIDLSDPDSPTLGPAGTLRDARAPAVLTTDALYVATGYPDISAIERVDLSDPTRPTAATPVLFQSDGDFKSWTATDAGLYFARDAPLHTELCFLPHGGAGPTCQTVPLYTRVFGTRNGRLLLADAATAQVYDIQSPAAATPTGGRWTTFDNLADVQLLGSYAISASGGSLLVFDLRKRESTGGPVAAFSLPASGIHGTSALLGDRMYAIYADRLFIVDVAQPEAPRLVNALGYHFPNARHAIATVRGGRRLLTISDIVGSLIRIDVTDELASDDQLPPVTHLSPQGVPASARFGALAADDTTTYVRFSRDLSSSSSVAGIAVLETGEVWPSSPNVLHASIVVDGGLLHWSDGTFLRRTRPDGSDATRVPAPAAHYVAVAQGYVFGATSDGLFVLRSDGTGVESVELPAAAAWDQDDALPITGNDQGLLRYRGNRLGWLRTTGTP